MDPIGLVCIRGVSDITVAQNPIYDSSTLDVHSDSLLLHFLISQLSNSTLIMSRELKSRRTSTFANAPSGRHCIGGKMEGTALDANVKVFPDMKMAYLH
jgi:hypothetical protein